MITSNWETVKAVVKSEKNLMKQERLSTTYSVMSENPIIFIDSGIGGLPYLSWIKEKLPDESFIYIADRENFPYGIKEKAQLLEILMQLIFRIDNKYKPKMAVIACNTASVISLSHLRKNFSIPFVGVVPAIKPAALKSDKKRIGLMASNRTIEDEYTGNLIEKFASECLVFRFAGTEIIDFIENSLYKSSESEIERILTPAVNFFKENNVDKVVLGCTHFIFLENILKKMLGKNVELVDSREGVGKQIIRVIEENGLKSVRKNKDLFIITGEENRISENKNYNWISEKYGLCSVQ